MESVDVCRCNSFCFLPFRGRRIDSLFGVSGLSAASVSFTFKVIGHFCRSSISVAWCVVAAVRTIAAAVFRRWYGVLSPKASTGKGEVLLSTCRCVELFGGTERPVATHSGPRARVTTTLRSFVRSHLFRESYR